MGNNWSDFENAARNIMLLACIPGMSVSVARGGELLYENGFGLRDRASRSSVDGDTVFGYASVTKSFTAVAVMQLAEKGKLKITDPIVRHIPELKLHGKAPGEVTIENLLTHRAGLPPLPGSDYVKKITTGAISGFPAWDPDEQQSTIEQLPQLNTFPDFIDYMNNVKYEMLGLPGQYFSYSNESWTLLGIIVERVSGVPYREYVRKHVLEPLGAERMSWSTEDIDDVQNVARIYLTNKNGETRLVPSYTSIRAFDPAGGLRGSVKDLSRWAKMFAAGGLATGGRLLSGESVARMWQNAPEVDMGRGYGFGVASEALGGHTLVSHGGGYIGISSSFGFVPDAGVSVAVLTNVQEVPAARVMMMAAATALGMDVPAQSEPQMVEIPASEHGQYTGVYMSGENKSLEIVAEDGYLAVSTGTLKAPLKRIDSDHVCAVIPGGQIVMKVFKRQSGNAWALLSGLRMLTKKE